MVTDSDERGLKALADVLAAMPVDTARAWARVRGRLAGPAQLRLRPWPAAASLTLVVGLLAAAQFGAGVRPVLAQAGAPAPRAMAATPALGAAFVAPAATAAQTRPAPPLPPPAPPAAP